MKDKLKIYQIVLIAVFAAALLVMGAVSILDTDPTVSERENRALKSYPKFSFSKLADGSFFTETEEAYNDTFPLRDFFVDVNSKLESLLTIKTKDGVLLQVTDMTGESGGEDIAEGYLQFAEQERENSVKASPAPTPSSGSVPMETPTPTEIPREWGPFDATGYEQFENGTHLDRMLVNNYYAMQIFNGTLKQAEAYVESMKNLRNVFPDQRIVSIVAPCSSAFYADGIYCEENHDQKAWLELLEKNMPGIICPDVYGTLKEHTDEYIYFRTDHHWTTRGAYYAYCAAAEELGFEPVDINSLKECDVGEYFGTLNSQAGSAYLTNGADIVYYYEPSVETEAVAHHDRINLSYTKPIDVVGPTTYLNRYACFIGGDNPLTVIKTTAGTGKNAVLIKNSFGNALAPWLCHNYDEIYIIDPRHVNTTVKNKLWPPEYFADIEIDDVYVCFNTLMAGTSTLNAGMEMLSVEGAYDAYLRYQDYLARQNNG